MAVQKGRDILLKIADGEAFFSQAQNVWQVIVPSFGTFAGPFLIAALEYAGAHDGEASFSLTLASAGEVSFDAG